MKNRPIKLTYTLFLVVLIAVFKNWFLFNSISAGDWNFRFENQISTFDVYPYVWSYLLNGIGGDVSFILGLHTYFSATANIALKYFNIPWVVAEKIVWFWPFLLISSFSSYFLSRYLFLNKLYSLFSAAVFIFNSYILMLVDGGQIGIAMAYAISPFVLMNFIKLIDDKNYFVPGKLIISGVTVAAQMNFDPRMFYITISGAVLYFIISKFNENGFLNLVRKFAIVFLPVGLIAFLINAFWILPLLFVGQDPIENLGSAYSSVESVRYFSFAKIEQSISLLHPYWPENVFGKVGFMKSEFLILPILAFSSLFFVKDLKNFRNRKYVLFFSLLGLMGAFLAKGTNEPFGSIYAFFFSYIPGFNIFRDPTKWYILVVLSYSVLIPFSVFRICELLKSKPKIKLSKFQNFFVVFVILYLLFLIFPALRGDLSGTLRQHDIPKDYINFEKFISQDGNFYRTFWVPAYQRFGFRSDIHPAISGQDFIDQYEQYGVVNYLKKKDSLNTLQLLGVKYIIVPFDSEGEIFLQDRKYDNTQYQRTKKELGEILWLKEVDCSMISSFICTGSNPFDRISIYEVRNSKEHFYIYSAETNTSANFSGVNYRAINQTKYEVEVSNVKKGDFLIFSESYSKHWKSVINPNLRIDSKEFHGKINSFKLPNDGGYSIEVYYSSQKWVNVGLTITTFGLFLISSFSVFGLVRKMVK